MWIEKQNVETGDATADGASTLAGAQFRITYYDGEYGEDSNGKCELFKIFYIRNFHSA